MRRIYCGINMYEYDYNRTIRTADKVAVRVLVLYRFLIFTRARAAQARASTVRVLYKTVRVLCTLYKLRLIIIGLLTSILYTVYCR